jgi:uncharacterized RDD family membrane protein YckC/uncharacterized membrane protein SpoIIM required for sporulation
VTATPQLQCTTPTRVPLALPLASLPERSLALLVDWVVIALVAAAMLFAYGAVGDVVYDWQSADLGARLVWVTCVGACVVLYDVVFEQLWRGQTPGKRALGICVVMARTGAAPDLLTSVLRTAVRMLDVLPFGYGVGLLRALYSPSTQRLGDVVAGTSVVRMRSDAKQLAVLRAVAAPGDVHPPATDGSTLLSFAQTAWSMTTPAQAALLSSLPTGNSARPLDHVLGQLRGAVQLRASPAFMVDHLALVDALDDKNAGGLQQLRAHIAHAEAALVRAHHQRTPPSDTEVLSVACWRAQRRWPRVAMRARWQQARVEFVQAPFTCRAHVVRALWWLALAWAVGITMGFFDAALVTSLLPDDLVRELGSGARWTDRIEQQDGLVGAWWSILWNNLWAGARFFVMGALLWGVGVGLAVFNALQLGAVLGVALRLAQGGSLTSFLLAHVGVEMIAAAVATGAGAHIGAAWWRPRCPRAQQVPEAARSGLWCWCWACALFLLAASIEAFVSPGMWVPWPIKAVVGVTTSVLTWRWLFARDAKAVPDDRPQATSRWARPE